MTCEEDLVREIKDHLKTNRKYNDLIDKFNKVLVERDALRYKLDKIKNEIES